MICIKKRVRNLLIRLLFASLSLVGCVSSYAVTNQELMDRLDDIEMERHNRELERLLDKELEQYRRQSSQLPISRVGCDQSFYKVLYKNNTNGTRACIFKDSIVKNSDGTISIVYLVEHDKPSYYKELTYYHNKLYAEISCSKRMIRVYSVFLLDNQFNKVTSFQLNFSKFESYGDIGPHLHSYVCR